MLNVNKKMYDKIFRSSSLSSKLKISCFVKKKSRKIISAEVWFSQGSVSWHNTSVNVDFVNIF